MNNPLLIEGKKFDLRLYVLMSGVEPTLAYTCQEGMVRFCTESYQKVNKDNAQNLFIHLTNSSLNKKSDNF